MADKEIIDYINSIESENKELRGQNTDMGTSMAAFRTQQGDPNLIEFQLELNDILEKIYHLLKGHIFKQQGDSEGEWVEPEDKNLQPLNEYGVQKIMQACSFLLNRNTILSNHKEDRINQICKDFGDSLTDDIFMEYEKMGLDTPDKKKKYLMLVLLIVINIENALMRSLHGGERESLRTARTVTQSVPMYNQGNMPAIPSSSKSKWWNPGSWGK